MSVNNLLMIGSCINGLNMNNEIYKSDGWVYYPQRHVLKVKGQEIRLRNHVHLVFLTLLENHGNLCTSNELMSAIWGEKNSSGFSGLRTAIWELRQVVKSVRTVPRKGYVLDCEVRIIESKAYFKWFYILSTFSLLILYIIIHITW